MGYIWLGLLLLVELGFMIWVIVTRTTHQKEKAIANIALALLFFLSLAVGLTNFDFRYYVLGIMMVIKLALSIRPLLSKKEKVYTCSKTIFTFVRNAINVVFVLSLALVCPSYRPLEDMGDYRVEKTSYTWVDETRLETYTNDGSYRTLTTDFFYPSDTSETYPLVVFSHGAFGYSGSNYSTFMTLASHGYVVASVSHTYQAFFTRDETGKLTIVNQGFLNQAVEINAMVDTEHEQAVYETTSSWMDLRTGDLDFVLEQILLSISEDSDDTLFKVIDTEHIGLFGHSLGGAASAQMGRLRDDIDAVIVLDGTMLGEEVAFEDGAVVLNNTPYPVPLLNVYAQDHYDNAKEIVGESYNNFFATENALEAYETVFLEAGHLNFTDLPLFSPLLASALGVGLIEARYCIEKMNDVVINFFDYFLKETGSLNIAKEY